MVPTDSCVALDVCMELNYRVKCRSTVTIHQILEEGRVERGGEGRGELRGEERAEGKADL